METSNHKIGKVFLIFVGICILALPFLIGTVFSDEEPPAKTGVIENPSYNFDENGAAIFENYDRISKEYMEGASTGRTLAEYYSRRQYSGSPPFIPHTVEKNDETNKTCQACHAKGGWSAELKRNTPLAPHPVTQVACRQCHVPMNVEELFVENQWESVAPPKLGRSYLPGSPPPVPHSLQNRGNCIACHVGPGAVTEIRVEHPMRGNCRQCHVPDLVSGLYERKSDY